MCVNLIDPKSNIAQIDTAKVLQEIHTFLTLYPSGSWQNKQSDLPLRTVKTLLFHLAKAKQSKIIEDLESLNVSEDSEIKIYIVKLFKDGFQLSSGNSNSNVANGSGNDKSGRGKEGGLDVDKVAQLRASVILDVSTLFCFRF